jgi:formate dehydrogenase major subunit
MSDPDVAHARAGLCKLEHLVVQDIFLTETAWHADVVLPASAHAEKWGTYTNTNRQVQLGRPVVDPPGEARQDWELICDLAQRVGLDWRYREVGEVFTEMASVMPSLANITWERILAEESVTYPCDAPDQPGNEIIFVNSFPTKSGRARIVPAELLPPDEVPDQDYPMVLTSGRLLEHWHTGSMTRRAGALDAIEPEAIAALSPSDLDRIGITPGARITVTTRRGAITLKARADRDVPDGMIFIPFAFAEAPANMLTNPQLDPIGKIPEFKFCAAKVERAEMAVARDGLGRCPLDHPTCVWRPVILYATQSYHDQDRQTFHLPHPRAARQDQGRRQAGRLRLHQRGHPHGAARVGAQGGAAPARGRAHRQALGRGYRQRAGAGGSTDHGAAARQVRCNGKIQERQEAVS